MNNLALEASFWGWLAGSALIIGASIGYFFNLSSKVISFTMAFGSGVLISALSFDLMDEAFQKAGLLPSTTGLIIGAVLYTAGVYFLNHRGARNRKRSGDLQVSEHDSEGSGKAIALGAFLDGIPESIVIGISLLEGKGVSIVAVIAIFLSNLPEGLSSSSGMKKAGRSAKYIFSLWFGIAFFSGLASLTGYSIFSHLSTEIQAATTALAAGAILAMIVDTMIPEAFEDQHDFTGIITVLGFMTAFILSRLT